MMLNTTHDSFRLCDIFQDLCPAAEHDQRPLALYASRPLTKRLAAAWPELTFGVSRGPLHAAALGATPRRNAGLVFANALLRPPVDQAGTWSSSTIAFSWKSGVQLPGLGERLLLRGDASAVLTRGNAIAACTIADRLGGDPPDVLLSRVERSLVGGVVLVEGRDATQDIAALHLLLRSGPAAKLIVLVHTAATRLARMAQRAGAIIVLRSAISPWTIASAAACIHAPLHDDFAVVARLVGRSVFTRGVPAPACAPGLLAAAYLVLATRYLDPTNGAPISCEAFLDRLIEWQRLRQRIPPIACFVGISFWKRQRMAEFAGRPVRFAHTANRAVSIATQSGGGIAVWPSRAPKDLTEEAARAGVPLYRIEDGFIRSRGLGADFIPPASVIIDQRGIYYDAKQPSDLEILLSEQIFTPQLLDRARRLMHSLVDRRITKYNLGGLRQTVAVPMDRRRILVPGQVADDLSVRAGGAGIPPGLALLAEVRRRNPDAFIIYKPHPDVEAGHRPGAVPEADLRQTADMVVRDVEMGSLIEAVDEVHTVTSLTGFEALLRHRQVTTYGRPFYAGWGLTTDIHPPPRRGRSLSLEELVAATLILYPHYLDPMTRLPCSPEHLIERLDRAADWRTGMLVRLRRGQGALRRNFGRGLARRILGTA